MSHFLMETAVGFSNIMPKTNLKTQVQASKYICVRLISSSFPNWPRNPVKRHSTRCLFFTYQTVELIRDQSTLRSSIYWGSNLLNLSTNHARYKLAIGHNFIWHFAGWQPFFGRAEIENFHDKDKRLKETFKNIKILLYIFL